MTEISEPVPVTVLISILGLPHEDIPLLIELTSEMAAATDSEYLPDPVKYPSDVDPRLLPFGTPAAAQVIEYGHRIGEQRRQKATDDLVSRLVHAEVDGERLNENEYANFFELFIFAGNETTRTGISQGILALMEHPDQFDRLLAGPELVPTAVDEVLRYGTPIIYFRRTATEDTEIRGVPIQAGDRVAMWFLSANFDEDVFDDPTVRHRPPTEPPHDLRPGRTALLPGLVPRPARDQDRARGDPRARSALRVDRAAGPSEIELRQRLQVDPGASSTPTLNERTDRGELHGDRRSSPAVQRLYLAGQWIQTGDCIDVRSPYSGELVARVARASADDARRAVERRRAGDA